MMAGRRIYKLAQDSTERIYNPNQGELFPEEDIFDKVQCTDCENYLTSKQVGNSDYYDEDDNPYCSEHVGECNNCKEKSPLANLKSGTEPNELFCDECFDELFVSCPNCDKTVEQNDFFQPSSRNQGRFAKMQDGGCTNCAVKCYSCDKVLDKEHDDFNSSPDGGESYCGDCFWEHYTSCEECSKIISREDSQYVEGDGEYCSSCFREKYHTCYECNEPV